MRQIKVVSEGLKWLFCLFVITLSCTNAFAISEIFTPPVYISLTILFFYLFYMINAGNVINFLLEDKIAIFIIIYLFVTIVLFSTLSWHCLNHFLSYFYCFFIYCYMMRAIMLKNFNANKIIFKLITIGVIFTVLVVAIEWVCTNIFGLDFSKYQFRASRTAWTVYIAQLFIRPRGFTGEPGVLAMYYNMFAPIAVYYLYKYGKNAKLNYFMSTLILLTYISLFSIGGFVAIILGVVVTSAYYMLNKHTKITITNSMFIMITAATLVCVVVIGILVYHFQAMMNNAIIATLYSKATFSSDSLSAIQRQHYWAVALQMFWQHPYFGLGAGMFSETVGTGALSWVLQTLAENGVFGIILFVIYLSVVFWRLLKLKGGIKYPCMMAFIAGLAQLFVVASYWRSWLWFLIAVIQTIYIYERQQLN